MTRITCVPISNDDHCHFLRPDTKRSFSKTKAQPCSRAHSLAREKTRRQEIVIECDTWDKRGYPSCRWWRQRAQRRESTPVCSLEMCLFLQEDQSQMAALNECQSCPQHCVPFLFHYHTGLRDHSQSKGWEQKDGRGQVAGTRARRSSRPGTNRSHSGSGPFP